MIELHVLEVHTPDDFESAFAAARRSRAKALLGLSDAFFGRAYNTA